MSDFDFEIQAFDAKGDMIRGMSLDERIVSAEDAEDALDSYADVIDTEGAATLAIVRIDFSDWTAEVIAERAL